MKKCSMKSCTTPIEEQVFNKNSRRKDGLNNICQVCSRQRSKQYYHDNAGHHKAVVLERQRKIRAKVRRKMFEYYSEHPCIDCGEADPLVLEFDHVRGVKRKEVSRLVRSNHDWDVIAQEIEKCEVRCANCHRRRTGIVQGWYKEFIEA
jgi:hypothetical protein